MKKLLFLGLIGLSTAVFGQLSKAELAAQLSNRYRFAEAYPVWSEVANDGLKRGIPDWGAVRMAFEAALKSEQFGEAKNWNTALIEAGQATPEDWIHRFQLALRLEEYSALSGLHAQAVATFPDHEQILEWSDRIAGLNRIVLDSANFSIARFRPHSNAEEFGAVPYSKGVVFVSNGLHAGFVSPKDGWTEQEFFDLAYIPDSTKPEPRFKLWDDLKGRRLWQGFDRTNTHDGPLAFSHDGKWAVLTRNQTQLDTLNRVVLARLELVFFQRINGIWSPTQSFPFNSPEWTCAHAAFFPDGSLIFASDMPGGFGGMDLYRCTWDGRFFAPPVNLGSRVNTAGNEVFPFVDANQIVYFSSDGHLGAGGLDVFQLVNDELKRVPRPISSSADDFAFYLDAKTGKGFLSSNRENGRDVIYTIYQGKVPQPINLILKECTGVVLNGARLELFDESGQLVDTDTTDAQGMATFKVPFEGAFSAVFSGTDRHLGAELDLVTSKSAKPFELIVRRASTTAQIHVRGKSGEPLSDVVLTFSRLDGSTFRSVTDASGTFAWTPTGAFVFTSVVADQINRVRAMCSLAAPDAVCPKDTVYTLVLDELSSEETIDLGMILYDLDKYALRPEGMRELNKLVRYMSTRPELRVELSSHTDSRAPDAYNLLLSQNRAQSCVDYIVAQGVEPTRIIARGYGEARLVNGCKDGVDCTDEEHQMNRRTELKLLD